MAESEASSKGLDPVSQFPQLYQREYASIYRTVRAILLDPAEAEDVTQDSFAKAYRARARYRPTAPVGAWLHRIAVNTALSHLRRRRLARLLPARLFQPADERDYLRSEARDACEVALAELSPQLRAAVVLQYFHDYSREETARILWIPSGTVASRTAKAMALMRAKMSSGEQMPLVVGSLSSDG